MPKTRIGHRREDVVPEAPHGNFIQVADRRIGSGEPVFIIAEIGINHNGSIDNALEMIDVAANAGCDAVKFQKRTPNVCVPEHQKSTIRETPWGTMTYLEYKERIEFGLDEFQTISEHAQKRNILWFASPWDLESVDFLESLDVCCFKVASACLTDGPLLDAINETGKPILLSTGMSTMDEIEAAVRRLRGSQLALAQATSTYPARPDQLNLRVIQSLASKFGVPVGYSGHETGLPTTVAAVALGATFIERHITLDRAMWGTDQAASIEPAGLSALVRHIRAVEKAMGDGIKRVYPEELPIREKLRVVSEMSE